MNHHERQRLRPLATHLLGVRLPRLDGRLTLDADLAHLRLDGVHGGRHGGGPAHPRTVAETQLGS